MTYKITSYVYAPIYKCKRGTMQKISAENSDSSSEYDSDNNDDDNDNDDDSIVMNCCF